MGTTEKKDAGKPFVEVIKSARPGRKIRRLAARAAFALLTAALIALTAAVILRLAGWQAPAAG